MLQQHRIRAYRATLALAMVAGGLMVVPSRAEERHRVAASGTVTVMLDPDSMAAVGWRLTAVDFQAVDADEGPLSFTWAVDPSSTLVATFQDGRFRTAADGYVQSQGVLSIEYAGGPTTMGKLRVERHPVDGWVVRDMLRTQRAPFTLGSVLTEYDVESMTLHLAAELQISERWALELRQPTAAGAAIGTLMMDVVLQEADADFVPPTDEPRLNGPGQTAGGIGPDVIVGDLPDVDRWGRVGDITAYSVATTSCNIGDYWLNWIASNSLHPVIAQNMYRLKDGRFEQIGMSWLKHGFFALSQELCSEPGGCDGDPTGAHLGVGCSDPYCASLNGTQGGLGPRFEVNATTGAFSWPYTGDGQTGDDIYKRLQVHDADLEPSLNAGARYYVSGQYVAKDDAFDGNQDNNMSYRRVNVSEPNANEYVVTVTDATVRMSSAAMCWVENDTGVSLLHIDVPDDRRFTLAYKVTDNGDGTWHYEYALENLNSDRSGQSFTIPMLAGVEVTNVGFRDVDYHSGEPYDGTDWTWTRDDEGLTWSTQTYAENPNANALRWGTLYNFRFDANGPPQPATAVLGLFKPGEPATMDVATSGPQQLAGVYQLSVSAPPTLDEYGSSQLSAVASFVDGPDTDVTTSTVWTVDPPEAGTIDANGVFTAATADLDQLVTITGAYTDGLDITVEGTTTFTVLDTTLINVDLVPSVDPSSLTPGQSFTVDIEVSTNGDAVLDTRFFQFDTRLTTGATVDAFTWDFENLVDDSLYLLYGDTDLVQAAYTGLSSTPGFIVNMDTTPQRIATLDVTYTGGVGMLDVFGDPASPSVDDGVRLLAGFVNILEYRQPETNVAGGILTLGDVPLAIASSEPPSGAIDARQPSAPDGSATAGWDTVEITFTANVAGMTMTDFTVSEAGGDGTPPAVSGVDILDADTVRVNFANAFEPVARLTITHVDSGTSVDLGYLPGDVNGDGTSAAQDLLSLIDHLNGVTPLPIYSTDIDRSGLAAAADVLREIDLLNGAGVYPPYLGVSLP